MKLTQESYEKLIADVEKEFSSFLAKAESEAQAEPLAKAEDAEDKKEAKADDKKESHDDDKHDYDDEDMEEMHKMYTSMSKGELKAHKDTMDKAWMSKCGEMTKSEPIAKSENTESTEPLKKAEDEASLAKAELEAKTKELETVKKDNEGLKKNVDELVAALNGFLTRKGPVRKAVTSIEYVKKSEEGADSKNLSKSEITSLLSKKARDPSLSKADREAINNYYCKEASLETVKHLLA